MPSQHRTRIQKNLRINEKTALENLIESADISPDVRHAGGKRAVDVINRIRTSSKPTMMESFLAEYGLSTSEGVALMCLAEALLRVPDAETIDELITDKIASSEWGTHLGHSSSPLVNASTWALLFTGKVLNEEQDTSLFKTLRGAVRRLGEPAIRVAVKQVMKELGQQFVLGESIEGGMKRAKKRESEGYTYSYDMLGEAACTDKEAKAYHLAYADAVGAIGQASHGNDIRTNPGISIKLSALHPRYDQLQKQQVMDELVPRARSLAIMAKSAGIGLNIDAEEADRLSISLDVIKALLRDPSLKGWDGFGVVVQAYGKRAPFVLDWLYSLAEELDRKIMVRLVKGAYWDTEIKHAQTEGLDGFPVFTRKPSTDVSYICCAKKLLGMTDRIYPQFATHNAHSAAMILEMADDLTSFEFQRLHGMGESLHEVLVKTGGARCRIYAPVGSHKDLLAYLVRRLLENGANSSFVNQIVDENVSAEEVAQDPFEVVAGYIDAPENPHIAQPSDLYGNERKNSKGWDIYDPLTLATLKKQIRKHARPVATAMPDDTALPVQNPATGEVIGYAETMDKKAIKATVEALTPWTDADAAGRAKVLNKVADLYEKHSFEIFATLGQEAGKNLSDCVGEVREAVDFLRYYARQAEIKNPEPQGIFACISPWNFPLAIFTGQISAALAAGNGVAAKPAESTPLIAEIGVRLMHEAGVPKSSLALINGTGPVAGAALSQHPNISGICFTGSTATAQAINRSMAENLSPSATLIAETGGLNAMIVDSTALPQQATRDIINSAFQSAGQRCSALRILYVQEDVADNLLTMIKGAMDCLTVADPTDFATDVGPLIDATAQKKIQSYVDAAKSRGALLKQLDCPKSGFYVGPALIKVSGIEEMAEEMFGPVLHVATFKAAEIDKVINAINASGYGLTFGLHTRIDDRVQHIVDRIEAGNIYVNRNQIGAIVGSQPFGGEGLSGTGPKAGGPNYLDRFCRRNTDPTQPDEGAPLKLDRVLAAIKALPEQDGRTNTSESLPGPTGEQNMLTTLPKGLVLCLGPTAKLAAEQAETAKLAGCKVLPAAPGLKEGLDGLVTPTLLSEIPDLDAVIYAGEDQREHRKALAARKGPIVPLIAHTDFSRDLIKERHLCIDTTAAGGNASLLAIED
jgi:RHH-type proline utilization regulon transcriptional repressor/proline dehydrogenase/delta 1-pyrroline-5-carboxylate dehydrogenase